MQMKKREFLSGTTFLGMAGLTGITSGSAAEQNGVRTASVSKGRDDGGKGDYTPHFGFLVRKLSHSVISSNTLFRGYMKEMTADLGEHGQDYVFTNNVGCPITV